jgi:lysophospholipase L1-like esterase
MSHVVLLGDSIFDNAAYVPGEPDVVMQLSERLPEGWQASLLAVDGAVARSVHAQVDRIPADATHLILSAGGNDALGHLGLLEGRGSALELFLRLADAAESFGAEYRRLVGALHTRRLPLAVCTIYEGALEDPQLKRAAAAALTAFNDVILRTGFERGLPVLDLRSVCSDPSDYANPIEPSAAGGRKIAAGIAGLLATHDFAAAHATVYGPAS